MPRRLHADAQCYPLFLPQKRLGRISSGKKAWTTGDSWNGSTACNLAGISARGDFLLLQRLTVAK